MNKKNLFISIITAFIVLEILSISIMDSITPWAILHYHSIGLKIIGWYLIAQIGLSFLAMIFISALPDRPCPICNHDLKAFIPVYGSLVICPRCRSMFHKNCFKSKLRCPICYPEDEEKPDVLLDFRRD